MISRWIFNLLLSLVATVSVSAQEAVTQLVDTPRAILIQTYTKSTAEERSLFFDLLFAEMARTPESKGYILLYCGKVCKYGEIDAHLRGMALKTRFNELYPGPLVVLNAGFRDVFTTELWVVPPGACPPTPTSAIRIKDVRFKGAWRRGVVAYECCF